MSSTYFDPAAGFNVWGVQARTDAAGVDVGDYSGEDARVSHDVYTPGVVKPVDGFLVSERGAGANMSVDVAVGSAFVEGTEDNQGMYGVRVRGATATNVTIGASDLSNPRIDEIYLVVVDDAYDAGGLSLPRIAYRDGTPASSPSAPGPDAAWDAYLLLGSILVPAGALDIENADITDARVYAAPIISGDLSVGGDLAVTGGLTASAVNLLDHGARHATGGADDLAGAIAGYTDFGGIAEVVEDTTLSTSFEVGATLTFTKPASWTSYKLMAWGTVHFAMEDLSVTNVAWARVVLGEEDGPTIMSGNTGNFGDPISASVSARHTRTGLTASANVRIEYAEGAGTITKRSSIVNFIAVRTS